MPEIRIISRNMPAEMPRQSVWSSSAVTRPNGSSFSKPVLRSARRIVRTSSVAAVTPSTPPLGFRKMPMSSVGAMCLWKSVSGM